jgi:DNA-directed RNA polymerase specialized sigma subunit
MKNYTNSDYALNKYSGGIVYRFADKIVEVTLEDYLAENPDKTAADFAALKAFSDSDYLAQVRKDNAQTKKNTPFDELSEMERSSEPSPEAALIDVPEEAERQRNRAALAEKAFGKLTDVQRRRYLMYHVEGKTIREIAEIEGAHFTSVQESLAAAEKRIKKFLGTA